MQSNPKQINYIIFEIHLKLIFLHFRFECRHLQFVFFQFFLHFFQFPLQITFLAPQLVNQLLHYLGSFVYFCKFVLEYLAYNFFQSFLKTPAVCSLKIVPNFTPQKIYLHIVYLLKCRVQQTFCFSKRIALDYCNSFHEKFSTMAIKPMRLGLWRSTELVRIKQKVIEKCSYYSSIFRLTR